MEKNMTFNEPISRHVNWNSIFPMMVDIWDAVNISKDRKTGAISVNAIESKVGLNKHELVAVLRRAKALGYDVRTLRFLAGSILSALEEKGSEVDESEFLFCIGLRDNI